MEYELPDFKNGKTIHFRNTNVFLIFATPDKGRWFRSSTEYLPAGRQGASEMVIMEGRYFVYVLKSVRDGRFYKGMTSDVERRMEEHNAGKTKSTRAFGPWILIHKESFSSKEAARKREKYLKSGAGREFIKNGFVAQLNRASDYGSEG